MGASYQELTAELIGSYRSLSPFLAQKYINRAWRDIRNAGRIWSWQVGDTTLTLSTQIATGTAAVTQFSPSVVLDVPAAAVVAAIVAGAPLITARQFRAGGTAIYNITAYDAGTRTLTLDRNFVDGTNAAATYQIYQCYYPAPVSDFVRWVSVTDPVNNYDLHLDHTRQELDFLDPGRQSQDQPYWVVSYKLSAQADTAVPLYELWPHPTTAGNLLAYYQRRGADLALPTDTLPPCISSDLVIQRALGWHVYPWAMANQGSFPELKGVNWGFLINDAKTAYEGDPSRRRVGLLQQAIRQDDDTFNSSRIFKWRRALYPGPIDSNWMQRHGVPVR